MPRRHPIDWARNLFSGTPHRSDSKNITLQEHRRKVVDVPFAQGHLVSPAFFSFLDFRFYVYRTEERHSERNTEEERKRKEREESFCGKLTASPERCHSSGSNTTIFTITPSCLHFIHYRCRIHYFRSHHVNDSAP